MCDCYSDRCRICGGTIEMHLGDYETSSGEIIVCHKACFEDSKFRWNDLKTLWKYYECEDYILVFCLTKNAWKNKDGNSLNYTEDELNRLKKAK